VYKRQIYQIAESNRIEKKNRFDSENRIESNRNFFFARIGMLYNLVATLHVESLSWSCCLNRLVADYDSSSWRPVVALPITQVLRRRLRFEVQLCCCVHAYVCGNSDIPIKNDTVAENWKHQSVKFDFTSDLTGTGNRSEEVIKWYCFVYDSI